jgi:hypothetical protein
MRLLLTAILAVALVVGLVPDARAARSQPIGPNTIGVVGGVTDPFALGLYRTWDSDTNWCDIQPTADADMTANLERILAPRLDQALSLGATGAIISLGHAAPWVFNNHPRALRAAHRSWFCGGLAAGVAIPSSRELRPGQPQYERWTAYVDAVMSFAANRYAGKLDLSFQVWNEPNLRSGIDTMTRIPGSARSRKDAAKSLWLYERATLDLIQGRYSPYGFSLIASSLYQRSTSLSKHYLKRHKNQPLFQALAFNVYTKRGKTAATMVNDFDRRAKSVAKQIRKYRKLRQLPMIITEFNHNLVNQGQNRYNLSPAIASADAQRLLASATQMDALYHGFSSVVWLSTWRPNQVAVRIHEVDGPARTALAELRSALVGTTLTSCRSKRGTRTCYFVDDQGRTMEVHWRPKGTRTVTVPYSAIVLQMDGSRTPVPAGSVLTIGQTPVVVGPQ